jgi:hypothetical protein
MATYEDNFSNPITSQYDPRIAENDPAAAQTGRVDSAGNVVEFNPEMVGMFSGKNRPKEPDPTYQSTYTDPATGDIIDVYIDAKGKKLEKISKPGTVKRDAELAAKTAAAEKMRAGQSAYDIMFNKFNQYGLGSLVEPLKKFIVDGTSDAEFTMLLRDTDAYKKRFAANAQRVAKGLTALDESTYIGIEDQYQNVMRQYGLPESYWKKDAMGTQAGFTDLLANDIASTELESRIQEAADILDKSPSQYLDALKNFYPEIQRGDLMAYVLDPKNGIKQIQSKVGAAKIGGEYLRAGLGTNLGRAEELQREGVTAETARTGAQAVKENAQRGSELAAIYNQGEYGQSDVESEVYNLGNASEAKKKREKLRGLQEASFSAKSGVGVLDANRGGNY